MPAIAITDRDNLFGSMEFSQAAAPNGVQPIIGIQLSLKPLDADASWQGVPDQLMLYAANEAGYHNLMKLASKTYVDSDAEDKLGPLVSYDALAEYAEGVIALTAGIYGAVGRAFLNGRADNAEKALKRLQEMFPNRLYVELMRHGLPEEKKIERAFIDMAMAHKLPLVATNDIYFHGGADMYEAHDALLCVAEGRYVSEAERRRLTPEHRFKTADEMRMLFRDIPEAIANTMVIAKRCAALAPARDPILPSFTIEENGKRLSEEDALRVESTKGLEHRLDTLVFTDDMDEAKRKEIAKPYFERLEFELGIIIEMGFPGYFLIVSDFISWAKEQDIPVGPGRGSGAASVVAWSLLITDLDPLQYDLVFERFLNPERVSMPDFDIDFCQDRREEVIKYVQVKYGYEQVAQIITFGKLQARAVLRDVGRVLQMPYNQVDRICKMVPNNPAQPCTLAEAVKQEPDIRRQMKDEEEVAHLIKISLKLEGLYRHCSTHAAGVVIGDRPLDELVALYRDPKSDMPVVQFSMKYAEMCGLVKFDFLGLKTLSVLKTAVDFIARRGVDIDLLTVPVKDEETFKMLGRGETIGVFQFESQGMQDALRKMRPDSLDDLVALAALYRPGPMDNIPIYIDCKHGKSEPDYMHPMLQPVLEETYGVIIYQEQVQRIAQIMAGYTLGGADLLRRAMGKKIKAEMDSQREKFVKGAAENGISDQQSNDIFDHVAKFAGYGFNKAHAAAYGFIGYQTAYLKANFPAEFMAASMTYDLHNTDKLAIFREDIMRMGLELRAPDINESSAVFEVEDNENDKAVRYALGALKNVGEAAMESLVAEREANGKFKDIFDVMSRADSKVLNRRQLENLIKAGAFDSMNENRKQLFESLDMLLAYAHAQAEERESNQINLFGMAEDNQDEMLPPLAKCDDWAPLEKLEHECNAVGFYISSHPLEGYGSVLKRLYVSSYASLATKLRNEYKPVKMAGIVTGKKIRTSDRGRFAFISLSDATGAYEASIFDEELLANSRDLLENGNLLMLTCEGKADENGARIIIKSMTPLDDAAKNAGSLPVTISLDPSADIPRLKELVGEQAQRGAPVLFTVQLADKRLVDIQLKGKYRVEPENILQLQTMPGVLSVAEG